MGTGTRVELILGIAFRTDLVEKYRSFFSLALGTKPVLHSAYRGLLYDESLFILPFFLLSSFAFSSTQTSLKTLSPAS